jgi:prohibitin 1
MRLFAIAHYCLYPVPIAIGVALLQSSLYDVPGGFRAVMFDRFSGVQDQV